MKRYRKANGDVKVFGNCYKCPYSKIAENAEHETEERVYLAREMCMKCAGIAEDSSHGLNIVHLGVFESEEESAGYIRQNIDNDYWHKLHADISQTISAASEKCEYDFLLLVKSLQRLSRTQFEKLLTIVRENSIEALVCKFRNVDAKAADGFFRFVKALSQMSPSAAVAVWGILKYDFLTLKEAADFVGVSKQFIHTQKTRAVANFPQMLAVFPKGRLDADGCIASMENKKEIDLVYNRGLKGKHKTEALCAVQTKL